MHSTNNSALELEGKISAMERYELKAGTTQAKAVRSLMAMIESGSPLPDYKEWLLKNLGFAEDDPEGILKLEALLIDRFALALASENPHIPRILEYLEANEQEIFPEGLASYEFHIKVENYVEAASGGAVVRYQFRNEDGQARDLVAMSKYLYVLWDEEIDWLIADRHDRVVEEIARLGLISKPSLLNKMIPFAGEDARELRRCITGSEVISSIEAEARLIQIMILALPVLGEKYHLVGTHDRARWLVEEHHLPELADASDFISLWGVSELSNLLRIATEREAQNPSVFSSLKNADVTRLVFNYLKQHVPNLHSHLGHLLCAHSLGEVIMDDYNESEFGLDMMRQIITRGHQLPDGSYQAPRGLGHYHCYIEILKVWGDTCLDKLVDHLSSDEMLLAYQLLNYQPLLKHLSGKQRDRAFSGEMGL